MLIASLSQVVLCVVDVFRQFFVCCMIKLCIHMKYLFCYLQVILKEILERLMLRDALFPDCDSISTL